MHCIAVRQCKYSGTVLTGVRPPHYGACPFGVDHLSAQLQHVGRLHRDGAGAARPRDRVGGGHAALAL